METLPVLGHVTPVHPYAKSTWALRRPTGLTQVTSFVVSYANDHILVWPVTPTTTNGAAGTIVP